VWGHDAALGVLLLEAIPNEIPVSELGKAVALDEVARLINGLPRGGTAVRAGGVVSLADRVEFIFDHWIARHARRGDDATRAVSVDRLRRGHELARALVADRREPVLLHGDLHPSNVLDGGPERGLVAIDPRPCVGEAEFDAVDWVFWGAHDPRVWKARSRELALPLGVDHERLWAWCAALAALIAAARAARGTAAGEVAELAELTP
jgi:streptomycin 6-kinase